MLKAVKLKFDCVIPCIEVQGGHDGHGSADRLLYKGLVLPPCKILSDSWKQDLEVDFDMIGTHTISI